jgi:hypothetical protein
VLETIPSLNDDPIDEPRVGQRGRVRGSSAESTTAPPRRAIFKEHSRIPEGASQE